MAMFEKQIRFTGKHATILQKYSRDKGGEQDVPFIVSNNDGVDKKISLFDTKIHCYMVAAMLGILNKRKADVDRSPQYATIFAEVLSKQRQNLERIYHHMILSEESDSSIDSKIKKAFSLVPSDKCDEEQKKLEDYVRGGLEIIDEYFSNCKSYEDICNTFFALSESIDPSFD